MRLEVVWTVGRGWAGGGVGGQGAYTRRAGEEQTRQEAPVGECES